MSSRPGQVVIECPAYSLPIDDIDTDQIYPAEFLATTERDGLGQYCFYYWRHDEQDRALEDHPLADFEAGRHQVLVTGKNFGCGSSREHAPWALLDMGLRAVISSQFADIFQTNALKNGLLPITLDLRAVNFLLDHPNQAVRIDIAARTIEISNFGTVEFPLDPFAAHCLVNGIDQLEFLLRQDPLISEYEQSGRPGFSY
jgi:3-isopropylmalate/(R)-2-methylmalate dehydratase small subunit